MRIMVEVDDDVVWSAVFGSGFEMWPWWSDVTFHNGATWESANGDGFAVVAIDCEGEVASARVTPDVLAEAITNAVSEGVVGMPRDLDDIDWDSCAADVILQFAVFGEGMFS